MKKINYNTISDFRDIVAIDLTTKCNYRCSFCILSDDKLPNRDMPIETFKDIVDQIKDEGSVNSIYLHFFGEPYLYPNITEAIQYLRSLNMVSSLATNGSLFNRNLNQIIENPPSHMTISIQDRICKEHYDQTIGASGHYDKYMEEIRYFIKRRMENGISSESKIDIELAVNLRDNFINRILGLPVGDLSVKTKLEDLFIPLTDFIKFLKDEIPQIEYDGDRLKSILEKQKKQYKWERTYKLFDNLQLVFKDISPNKDYDERYPIKYARCDSKFLVIAVNGDVRLCCIDYLGKTTIGNVFENSIGDICRNNISIFKSLLDGKPEPDVCKRCLGAPTKRGAYVINTVNKVRQKYGLAPYN